MTRQRLALVTERFWPQVSGEECVIRDLIDGLRRHDIASTVITAQWEKAWPRQMQYGSTPVVRLPRFGHQGWARIRYLRALSRWLRSQMAQFDLVMVAGMKYEAHAAISSLARSSVPVVLRVSGGGTSGDCQWHATHRLGATIARRCKSASAYVVPDDAVQRELEMAGFVPSRIQKIAPGVEIPPARSRERRAMARRTLSGVHEILGIGEMQPLVVFADYLHESMGVDTLLDAWEMVLSRWPKAKLWIVGEGPSGRVIWDRVRQLELENDVILPGSFDDLTDIFHAADLFVMPSQPGVTSTTLVQAMAAGIPIAASDTEQHRALINHGQHGLLFAPQDSASLATSVFEVLDAPDEAARRTTAARDRISNEHSLQTAVRLHVKLFDDLQRARMYRTTG